MGKRNPEADIHRIKTGQSNDPAHLYLFDS